MALKDSDARIIQDAKLGIAELEKIAHPSAPTLQLPVRHDEGEKELSIHWSRPQIVNDTTHENGDVQPGDTVWERFRESRNGIAVPDEAQQDKSRLKQPSEVQQSSNSSVKNRTVESVDGPTPSKQQKLDNAQSGELMDTSEDELLIPPVNDEKSDETASKNAARANEEHSASATEEPSSYTLKEIQGNATSTESGMGISPKESANDNEQASINRSMSNGDVPQSGKADLSERQVKESLEDTSDDEAMLGLFCDELKDS